MNHVRRGSGRPLLLVHGLGAGWRSWEPIMDGLTARRGVIAIDLPGFGETPALNGEVSIATLTDSVARFFDDQGLDGVATVGHSIGARMVLELARRGCHDRHDALSQHSPTRYSTGPPGAATSRNGTRRMMRPVSS